MQQEHLKKTSENPLYIQLMTRIKNDIVAGVYQRGERVPSEQELCDSYGVSRVTVRKAMLDLVQEGLLVRRQGKGTFVAEKRIQRDLQQFTSFTSACRQAGYTPSTRVLSVQWDEASDEEVERLHMKSGDRILEITRLRYADNLPVALEVNRFGEQYSFLVSRDLSQSIYETLNLEGSIPSTGEHFISLGHATPYVARHLQNNIGEALLILDEVVYDQKNEPIYSGRQWIRGDKYTFRI